MCVIIHYGEISCFFMRALKSRTIVDTNCVKVYCLCAIPLYVLLGGIKCERREKEKCVLIIIMLQVC